MAVTDSPGAGRVLVATSGGPLVAEPSWTRYDALDYCRLYEYTCESGRQSELDVTDTGTARVLFHDRAGAITKDLVGKQILLQIYDPEAGTWNPRWRGHVDDCNRDLDPSLAEHANVQLECVDIFDYLGGAKFLPYPAMGFALPSDMYGVAFYEDANVDDRIKKLLTDAGIDSTMRVVFTGNVSVNETLYDFDFVILQGLRDAADAEFPGIANVFVDRFGRVAFHGRFARFDPEGVAAGGANWDFVRWYAATRGSVTGDNAQIREFAYNTPRDRVINSYHAWPREDENGEEVTQAVIATLVQQDSASQTALGYRGKEAPDLIVQANINNGNTSVEECELYGQFYVENYSELREAVDRITFKALRPDGSARSVATWALMVGIDVSDGVNLTVPEAGLADEPFFVDGISVTCRPAGTAQDYVEVTPNLTPASYYGTDVFNP